MNNKSYQDKTTFSLMIQTFEFNMVNVSTNIFTIDLIKYLSGQRIAKNVVSITSMLLPYHEEYSYILWRQDNTFINDTKIEFNLVNISTNIFTIDLIKYLPVQKTLRPLHIHFCLLLSYLQLWSGRSPTLYPSFFMQKQPQKISYGTKSINFKNISK